MFFKNCKNTCEEAQALAKLKKKTTKVGYRLLKKRRREKEVLLVLKKKQSKAKQGSKETCSYCLKKSKASQVDKAKQRRLFKNPFIFDKEEVRSTQAHAFAGFLRKHFF